MATEVPVTALAAAPDVFVVTARLVVVVAPRPVVVGTDRPVVVVDPAEPDEGRIRT
jgi:hypothetical protein